MKKPFQYTLLLLILSFFLNIAGLLSDSLFDTGITLPDIALLTLAFFTVTSGSIFIFFIGQGKTDHKSQTFFTLTGTSLKFLMELIIALVWFLIAKKTSISFILLFFVLYLTFTTFHTIVILNALKNKSL